MTINKFKIYTFLSIVFLLVSCTPDTIVNNTGETITTVKLLSKKLNKTFTFINVNNKLTSDTIFLPSSVSDTFQVSFYNETSGISKDITPEITSEKNDHQIFFNASSDANIAFRYLDEDDNKFPIGLKVEVTTGGSSKGTLGVILKHQPDIKNGSQNIGSTDLDATFVLIIK